MLPYWLDMYTMVHKWIFEYFKFYFSTLLRIYAYSNEIINLWCTFQILEIYALKLENSI